ncbi:hypothetical protein [Serratia marcescens]|uniref:hypothetical protein n=1 Tax=Serratia marcescens TaxID=615 RepID=UPI002FD8CA41
MAKRNRPEIPAAISITRPGGGDEPRIEITIKTGVGKSITVEMTPEQFAMVITGKSEEPVTLRLRNLELMQAEAQEKVL